MFARGIVPLLLGILCFAESAAAGELRAGNFGFLSRSDHTGLASFGEELRIVLIERQGAMAIVRLTPMDRDGLEVGVGRVIALRASERYELQPRSVFSEAQLAAIRLRVEVLSGRGAVEVVASSGDGPDLTFAAEEDGPVRRRPVHLRSSNQLIDEAEASGSITAETAILYRVYVLFADTRLPVPFRGSDRDMSDSLYLAEVVERFDTFSPATQELLRPFLTPPAYTNSWATSAEDGVTAQATPAICHALSGAWGFVDATALAPVRIWYQKGTPDEFRASSLASLVQSTIWPKFTAVMGNTHLPLSDLTQSCNGGDGRLDIYLVNLPNLGLATPYSRCKATPVFLQMNRAASDEIIAHEIFHAFQFSFGLPLCLSSPDYQWWTEGSALWSENLFAPAHQREQDFAPTFMSTPGKPLDLVDGDPCYHCYSTYLLPLYLEKKTGGTGFMRTAWENCEREPALEAVNRAIPGGFAAHWPEFVLRNWNDEPIWDLLPTDNYLTWDELEDGVSDTTPPEEVTLRGSRDRSLPIPVDLPRVSSLYKHYKFTDANIRTVAFWNGLTNSLSRPDEYELDAASEAQKKGAHIWALIKIRGQPWTKEDWTGETAKAFCRDRGAERIDELVLIISNSEFSDRNRKLKHPGLAPQLWVSNMACYQWKGTSQAVVGLDIAAGGVHINANATFTSFGAAPPFIFYSVTGTQTWSISGTSCTGGGTLPIASGIGFLMTHNFTPPGGEKHRGYAVVGLNQAQNVTIQCGSPPQSHTITLPPWIFSEQIEPPLKTVKSTGETIDDFRFPPANQTGTYTWHFDAQSEPGPPAP